MTDQPNRTDNDLLKRQDERQERHNDVFRSQIVKNTTNESNLGAHYEYSPERWRLFKGSIASGNRLFPEYGAVPEYNHAGDYHQLIPAAGETIIFETAERYRYIVQYELEATWAWAINQSLNTGDYVRCGYYDGTNGWFLEHNGDHATDEVDLVSLRDGSEQYRVTETVSKGGFQTNTRFGLETAWYDVSRQKWTQSFPKDGEQKNPEIATLSLDDQRGPQTGNLNLRFEVHASETTNNLILEAGSCALVTKGSGVDNVRTKAVFYEDSVDTADVWYPIRAYREVPDREVINNQLITANALSYSSDTNVQMAMLGFDETQVTFTGTDSWGTPPIWESENNSLQTRGDVDTIVDVSNTPTSAPADPGGFQIGFSTLIPTTGAQFQKGASDAEIGAKRNLPNGDVGVLCVNAGATGTIGHAETWEQDW